MNAAPSPYLLRPLRQPAEVPVLYRFYADFWNRGREHELTPVWARSLFAAIEQARESLEGTGCEFVEVDPDWDAVVTADGRTHLRQQWEASHVPD